jgi:hypothetical protein
MVCYSWETPEFMLSEGIGARAKAGKGKRRDIRVIRSLYLLLSLGFLVRRNGWSSGTQLLDRSFGEIWMGFISWMGLLFYLFNN